MNRCSVCQLPVIELDGQFENLEAYYAKPDHPAAELLGECHSNCIGDDDRGRTWHDWRVHNYSTGRGYNIAAESGGWTVLVHRRHPELIAFHIDGFSVGGERQEGARASKAIDGGILVPIEEEFNLASDDIEFIERVKSKLKTDAQCPIPAILEMLGVANHIKWPRALENAAFTFDSKMQRDWTRTAVGMRARYAKFLPAEVVPFWDKL